MEMIAFFWEQVVVIHVFPWQKGKAYSTLKKKNEVIAL